LHYAADGCAGCPGWCPESQVKTIRALLDAGAPVNAQDKNGATPLHRAVRTRCAAAVRCLLEAGADPLLPNLPGSTPFHLAVQDTGRGGSGTQAARAAQREILRQFLRLGLSPALTDRPGKSVLDSARSVWIREALSPDARA
jgi:ankyrin repeat protein